MSILHKDNNGVIREYSNNTDINAMVFYQSIPVSNVSEVIIDLDIYNYEYEMNLFLRPNYNGNIVGRLLDKNNNQLNIISSWDTQYVLGTTQSSTVQYYKTTNINTTNETLIADVVQNCELFANTKFFYDDTFDNLYINAQEYFSFNQSSNQYQMDRNTKTRNILNGNIAKKIKFVAQTGNLTGKIVIYRRRKEW
jgi:hypothetical protein